MPFLTARLRDSYQVADQLDGKKSVEGVRRRLLSIRKPPPRPAPLVPETAASEGNARRYPTAPAFATASARRDDEDSCRGESRRKKTVCLWLSFSAASARRCSPLRWVDSHRRYGVEMSAIERLRPPGERDPPAAHSAAPAFSGSNQNQNPNRI